MLIRQLHVTNRSCVKTFDAITYPHHALIPITIWITTWNIWAAASSDCCPLMTVWGSADSRFCLPRSVRADSKMRVLCCAFVLGTFTSKRRVRMRRCSASKLEYYISGRPLIVGYQEDSGAPISLPNSKHSRPCLSVPLKRRWRPVDKNMTFCGNKLANKRSCCVNQFW